MGGNTEQDNYLRTTGNGNLSIKDCWLLKRDVFDECLPTIKTNTLYSETCLNRTSLGQTFVFGIDKCWLN
jgi:hypothetical protein